MEPTGFKKQHSQKFLFSVRRTQACTIWGVHFIKNTQNFECKTKNSTLFNLTVESVTYVTNIPQTLQNPEYNITLLLLFYFNQLLTCFIIIIKKRFILFLQFLADCSLICFSSILYGENRKMIHSLFLAVLHMGCPIE